MNIDINKDFLHFDYLTEDEILFRYFCSYVGLTISCRILDAFINTYIKEVKK